MHRPADFTIFQGLVLTRTLVNILLKNLINFLYIQSWECQERILFLKKLMIYSIRLRKEKPFFMFERMPVIVPLNLEQNKKLVLNSQMTRGTIVGNFPGLG